jgi:hypothetical protein
MKDGIGVMECSSHLFVIVSWQSVFKREKSLWE